MFRMRIASIITSVPVPLSVAPLEPSQLSKCALSITYSLFFSPPGIIAITFPTGISPWNQLSAFTRTRGCWPRAREASEQAEVLAAHIHERHRLRARAEDPVHPPAAAPCVAEGARGARAFERVGEIARRDARGAQAAREVAVALRARRAQFRQVERLAVLRPRGVGAAGRLRHGDEHELPLHRAQEAPEVGRRRERRHGDDIAIHVAPAGARAPREHHRLERAHARREQVHVRGAALPRAPGAVVDALGADPPRRVARDDVVLRAAQAGAAGEPRPHGVEERLREVLELARVALEGPEPSDGGIRGHNDGGLRADRRGEREGEHSEAGAHWGWE